MHPTHWLIYAQAATRGDCAELRELIAEGAEVTTGDYDNRTALHLAAAEGHLDAVEFLAVWKSNCRGASQPLLNHDFTPSTRRHLDGVAVWVLHDSIQSSGPRRRREMT